MKQQENMTGEKRAKIRAAKKFFTPCAVSGSLLEAIKSVTKNAVPGDVILLSPACLSFDQFRKNQQMGEVSRYAENALATAMGSGRTAGHPNMQAGKNGKSNANEN